MAEVLTPLMQPSSSITMLHSRPSSSDAFQGSQQQYAQPQRLGQAPRGMYHGQNNSYRGASPPVQPYAFQSTPNLRQDVRTTSAPTTTHGPIGGHRTTASVSTSSSDTSSQPSAKDDSVIGGQRTSFLNLSSVPDLSLTTLDAPVKASPDRYRRPGQKRNDSSSTTVRTIGAAPPASVATNAAPPEPVQRQASVDDMALPRTGQTELAKRYRRRSLNQLETAGLANPPQVQTNLGAQRPTSGHGPSATSTPTTIRPVSFHQQDGEGALQNGGVAPVKVDQSRDRAAQPVKAPPAGLRVEQKVNVPARSSSNDAKRLAAPSPLSRQTSDADSTAASVTAAPPKPRTYAAVAQAAVQTPSPAAAQLAAVSDKDLNKGMKSRLRRAFSFGSAQELRRAAGENHQAATNQAHQVRQQHQQQIDDEMDAEQMEIARRQEAAGIGAGIYSGQGGFTGSTDNLSISSTASSASMMLRKMGRGAKKSAKSIRGIFRPKSVIGVPAADGPVDLGAAPVVQPTVAQVSMVTVEAERLAVNVNAHPGDAADGHTGFPKLERNSLDAGSATAAIDRQRGSADGSDSRRSIVGSDKDRAEVLAAVKKGILKRSGTASPNGSPSVRPSDAGMTPVPRITESPASSMPSTPRDAPAGRSSSAPIPNGDYFSAGRVTVTKSVPSTPNGGVRSISFSPRIQFHDVWSSHEYDRRAEIATCNRLTPMLAQQIKEELNTFKMEMEVHELSKPHTHFF